MPTATVQNIRLIVAAAAVRGIPPVQLLAAIPIEPQQLIDQDGRVPAELAVRAWQVAARMCNDPAFGLAVVEHVRPDSFGTLGWAIHASATVGAGLERLSRFLRLVNQLVTLAFAPDGELVRVRMVIEHDVAPDEVRHPVECLMSAIMLVVGRATGEPLRPSAVAFRHAAPADVEPHCQRFGIVPAFAQPHSELVLHRRVLDTPHLAPDPELTALAERHLRRLLAELPASETFAGRVRRVLGEELRHGEPTVARVVARLRVSERTLQRRLQQEDTSLHGLLDELRQELALRHLRESRESIAEISFLLGFSEVRAFHRAFKRWTGTTPGAFRDGGPAASP